MQCKCGALISSREHAVTTLSGANGWLDDPEESDLPLRVIQWECPSCARYRAVVMRASGGRTRTIPAGAWT